MSNAPIASSSPGAPGPSFGALALAAGVLALATLAVYAPVLGHPFLSWDDGVYVVDNPNLREPFGLASIVRAFAAPYESNWIPFTWISLHVDYALFGPDPRAFHAVNLALHLATSLVLLVAFARATGSLGASAFVAGVFALHPVHVESVAWAAQRKDCLSGLFFALALAAHFRHARAPSAARLAAVAVAGAAAMASKPSAVVLPFVLLALDHWPLRRLGLDPFGERAVVRDELRRALLEKLPLVALALLSGVATVIAQRNAGSIELLQIPFHWRAMNATWNYLAYVGMALWPSGLHFYYPWPLESSLVWKSALGMLAGVGATLLALRRSAADRAPLVGLAIYFVALLPVVGFVQVGMQGRADRYLYWPLLGLAIAAGFGLPALLGARARRALIIAGCCALVGLGVAARAQLRHWESSLALYQRAVDVDDANYFAHASLAGELERLGRPDEALEHYQRSVALRAGFFAPWLSLARLHTARGELDHARSALEAALELRPGSAEAWARRAENALARGAAQETRDVLARAREHVDVEASPQLRVLVERARD